MNKLNVITPTEYYNDWFFRVKHPETRKRIYLEKLNYLQNNLPKKIIKTHIEQVTYTLDEAFDPRWKAYRIFSNIFMTTKHIQAYLSKDKHWVAHSSVNMIIEIDWIWDLKNE